MLLLLLRQAQRQQVAADVARRITQHGPGVTLVHVICIFSAGTDQRIHKERSRHFHLLVHPNARCTFAQPNRTECISDQTYSYIPPICYRPNSPLVVFKRPFIASSAPRKPITKKDVLVNILQFFYCAFSLNDYQNIMESNR